MSTSQRISGGFHRLGLVLAACHPTAAGRFSYVALGAVEPSASEVLTTVFVTLGVSFAVYGLVRAIGWVIGGFAAS